MSSVAVAGCGREVITRRSRSGAQVPPGKDNAISDVERGDDALSPLSFHGSNILNAAIYNMPPLAFGIHNEQYGRDMVKI